MSARGDLATIIGEQFEHTAGPNCLVCADVVRAADAILAAGYSKPRTISTVEELDALLDGAVVMNCFGDASTVHWDVRERKAMAYHHLVKHGPATVLYTPKES